MPAVPAASGASLPHLDQLTAIRGLACLSVLIGHVVQVVNYGAVNGKSQFTGLHGCIIAVFNAQGAVLLFFVLSGCVLSMSLTHTERLTRRAVAAFYVRRIFRLYPLIWLTTCLAIGSVLAARPLVGQGDLVRGWLTQNVESPITPLHTVLSLIGVWTKYDGPLWSLRVELIYSALFPALYILVRNPRSRGWFIAALLALALLPVSQPQLGTPFGFSFALGALVPLLPRGAARLPAPIVLGAVFLLCYDRWLLEELHPSAILYDLVETMASAVIVRYVYASGVRHRVLSAVPVIWLGEWSFSIYLLHLPILLVILSLLQQFTDLPKLLVYTSLMEIGLGLATACVTILVSVFTYKFVELPLHNFGRRLARRIAAGEDPRRGTAESSAARYTQPV